MSNPSDDTYGDVPLGMECALPYLIAPPEAPVVPARAPGSMIQLDARLFGQFCVVLAVFL